MGTEKNAKESFKVTGISKKIHGSTISYGIGPTKNAAKKCYDGEED
jgi:hypothetical protein